RRMGLKGKRNLVLVETAITRAIGVQPRYHHTVRHRSLLKQLTCRLPRPVCFGYRAAPALVDRVKSNQGDAEITNEQLRGPRATTAVSGVIRPAHIGHKLKRINGEAMSVTARRQTPARHPSRMKRGPASMRPELLWHTPCEEFDHGRGARTSSNATAAICRLLLLRALDPAKLACALLGVHVTQHSFAAAR